jgi:hypothetical protein
MILSLLRANHPSESAQNRAPLRQRLPQRYIKFQPPHLVPKQRNDIVPITRLNRPKIGHHLDNDFPNDISTFRLHILYGSSRMILCQSPVRIGPNRAPLGQRLPNDISNFRLHILYRSSGMIFLILTRPAWSRRPWWSGLAWSRWSGCGHSSYRRRFRLIFKDMEKRSCGLYPHQFQCSY